MNRATIAALGIVLAYASGTQARATNADNPYQPIVSRNVFSLKPPPPPSVPEPPKPPTPKMTLNGITTIFGYKQALLTAQVPAKPGEAAKPQSFILQEGERDGDMEVLQIDDVAGSVKVKYGNDETTLTMEKDGAKPSGGAVAAAAPAAYTPPPNPWAPQPAGGQAANNFATLPTRTLRVPQANGAVPQYGGGFGATATAASGGQTLPGFSFGTAQPNNNLHIPPGSEIPADERAAMTELNYQDAMNKGDPTAALFPPSAIDPKRNLAPTTPDPNAALEQNPPTPTYRRVRATGP